MFADCAEFDVVFKNLAEPPVFAVVQFTLIYLQPKGKLRALIPINLNILDEIFRLW